MKKKILLLIGIFSIGITLHAQVGIGINTNNPQGVFHIDTKGDTSGNTNTSDDIVVSTAGNVGVGTNVPTSKLHIKTDGSIPGFRLEDGSEDEDFVLISDANGNAQWKANDFSSPGVIVWEGTHSKYVFKTGNLYDELFKAESFTFNKYNISSTVAAGFTTGVRVPAGIYLLFVNGDVAGESYTNLRIATSPVSDQTKISRTGFWSEHYISGTAYLNLTANTKMNIEIRNVGVDQIQKSGILKNDVQPHKFTVRITLLKIS